MDGSKPDRFHVVLGGSTGVSTNYIIDIARKSVILHDSIKKSGRRA